MNTASADEGKNVYVLGAGFSIPAGAPPQAQILSEIFGPDAGPSVSRKQKHACKTSWRKICY